MSLPVRKHDKTCVKHKEKQLMVPACMTNSGYLCHFVSSYYGHSNSSQSAKWLPLGPPVPVHAIFHRSVPVHKGNDAGPMRTIYICDMAMEVLFFSASLLNDILFNVQSMAATHTMLFIYSPKITKYAPWLDDEGEIWRVFLDENLGLYPAFVIFTQHEISCYQNHSIRTLDCTSIFTSQAIGTHNGVIIWLPCTKWHNLVTVCV